MRAALTRVKSASVTIDGKVNGQIGFTEDGETYSPLSGDTSVSMNFFGYRSR